MLKRGRGSALALLAGGLWSAMGASLAVAQTTDTSGVTPDTATYLYDGLGRVTAVVYENGTGQVYSYDSAGNRSTSYSGTPSIASFDPAYRSLIVTEPANAQNDTVTLTVSRPSPGVLSIVKYQTVDGSAKAGINYVADSGYVTFLSSQTSKTISVKTTGDGTYDGPISFSVELIPVSANAAMGFNVAQIQMNDHEPAPVFTISQPAATSEGNTLNFTVTRSNPTSLTQSVTVQTADSSAYANVDYVPTAQILTFGPSAAAMAQTFSVPTLSDGLYEGNRAFTTALSGPTNLAVLGSPASATGTILDINGPPTFAINSPAAVNEGTPVAFTVTQTFPSGTNGTRIGDAVNVATANGTAIAGTNYTANSGTLTFAGGSTGNQSKPFSVATIDDHVITGNRTFTATLSNPTNAATIATATGTGTIANTDSSTPSAPVLSVFSNNLSTGDYTLKWTEAASAPAPTRYELCAGASGGSLVRSILALTYSDTQTTSVRLYQVRACNGTGGTACGSSSSCGPFSNQVEVDYCPTGSCN